MSTLRIAAQSLLDVLERGNVGAIFHAARNLQATLDAPVPVADPSDEQKPTSKQSARFAIDGAMAFGFQGVNEPEADHWLHGYWAIGRKDFESIDRNLADSERLEFIAAHPEMNLRYHKKHWSLIGFTNYEFPVFKTLREAIDKARGQS